MRRAHAAIIVLAILSIPLSGCLGGPNDRQFIDDRQYHEARRAFERTGSIDVVKQALHDAHWPNAEANEAIYRIEKEFGLHDSHPSPSKIRSEKELRAEEKADQTSTVGTISILDLANSSLR